MKTIEEIRDYLLEHRINYHGVLDLSGLDFTDFSGPVDIKNVKTSSSLHFSFADVGGDLYQSNQKVDGDLIQDYQDVKGRMIQSRQVVHGEFITQKLQSDEEYVPSTKFTDSVVIAKKRKKMTVQEIEEKLGYLITIVEEGEDMEDKVWETF